MKESKTVQNAVFGRKCRELPVSSWSPSSDRLGSIEFDDRLIAVFTTVFWFTANVVCRGISER